MTVMNEVQADCLRAAFAKLLGKPSLGTMAFVRCLAPEVIAELCGGRLLNIPGWEVFGVASDDRAGGSFITADRAVDLREEKQGSILLLVDAKEAGAGMDGIYSAVREIGETELLPLAKDAASKRLSRDVKDFAQAALRQARQLGRTNAISPWREFNFYAHCAGHPEAAGEYLALLGLWPVRSEGAPRKEDISVSAQIVERLLLPVSSNLTVHARVESLLLAPSGGTVRVLESFLRETSSLRWSDAVLEATRHPELWLNSITPGFVNQELRALELVPWRSGPEASPLKWSG